MAEAEKVSKWIYCNRCKGSTRHALHGRVSYRHEDEDGLYERGEYRLWSCAGCDTATLEDYFTLPGMRDEEGDEFYDSIFHPKRVQRHRQPKSFFKLPSKLGRIYREVVSAYNADLRALCAAGLRALMEGICADRKIPGKTLEKKIDGLTSILPKSIVDNLHNFRFIGNEALHELEAPKLDQLAMAINVIEDLLNFLYELDYKASLLAKARAGKPGTAAAAAPPAKAVAATAEDIPTTEGDSQERAPE